MEVARGKVFAGRGSVARRVRVAAAGIALISALGGGYAAGRLTATDTRGRERPAVAAVQDESSRVNGPAVHPRHFRPKWGGDGP